MGYALVHERLNICVTKDHWVMEHSTTMKRPTVVASQSERLRGPNEGRDGKVASVRLYQDLSALYAPAR